MAKEKLLKFLRGEKESSIPGPLPLSPGETTPVIRFVNDGSVDNNKLPGVPPVMNEAVNLLWKVGKQVVGDTECVLWEDPDNGKVYIEDPTTGSYSLFREPNRLPQ